MKVNYSITYLLIILCLYAIISCKERKEIHDFDIDILELDIRNTLSQKENTLFFSGLTREIKYIPLETNDSYLLRRIHKLILVQDHIFISDGRGLFQFDLSGIFVRQIGGPGKGPGEHGTRIRFTVDTVRTEILIFSSNIINVYDLKTGAYKRNFYVGLDVSDFAVFPQGNLVLFTHELPVEAVVSSINEVYLADIKGEMVDSIVNYNRLNHKRIQAPRGYVSLFSINKGELRYLYNYRDTLYVLTNDFERQPYAVFNLGNKISRDNLLIEPIYDEIQHPDFIWISEVLENSQYLFITLQKGHAILIDPDIQKIVYDKRSGDLLPTSGFINDIDGGMPFWPQFSAGKTLIASYLPYEIIEYYESTVGTADHSEGFINLIKNLDESDNPVLVFIEAGNYLKREE